MTGRGVEPHSGEALAVTDVPDERVLAKICIARHARDEQDTALLLDIVLGETHQFFSGEERRRGTWTSDVYHYPMPVGPGGAEYRARVRAWGRSQGYEVTTGGSPQGWLLNAYVEATGDVWDDEKDAADKQRRIEEAAA